MVSYGLVSETWVVAQIVIAFALAEATNYLVLLPKCFSSKLGIKPWGFQTKSSVCYTNGSLV